MAADILLSLGSAVDRVMGVFSPDRALSRHRARQLLARAYEGASRKDGWRPRRAGASANYDHRADAKELRDRSRSFTQNVPYVAQALRALVAAVVGTGIVPRWTGSDAAKWNDLWKTWGKQCDADGRLDIYGLEAAAYRACQQDGEVLIRLRPRLPADNLAVPLQVQLLEIDWLDSHKTVANGPNQVINGIEYDPLGKVAGYWLYDTHPGDVGRTISRSTSRFIPASAIIHLYTSERPGQGRGFPRIAPCVARVRDLQLYEDAELQRKNLETRLTVLASGNVSEMANPPSPNEPVDAAAALAGDLGPLNSGGVTQLPSGLNMEVVEPKAAPGYVDYVKYQIKLFAAGYGVTYEMTTGDVSEANFSSARVRLLDFRREAEMERWVHFVPGCVDLIVQAFADAAVLAGKFARPDYAVQYSAPRWDYVNPKDDVDTDLNEIAAGLSTISEKLRQRGYDPQVVFAEMKTDFDRLRQDGTLAVMLTMLTKKLPVEPSSD